MQVSNDNLMMENDRVDQGDAVEIIQIKDVQFTDLCHKFCIINNRQNADEQLGYTTNYISDKEW